MLHDNPLILVILFKQMNNWRQKYYLRQTWDCRDKQRWQVPV